MARIVHSLQTRRYTDFCASFWCGIDVIAPICHNVSLEIAHFDFDCAEWVQFAMCLIATATTSLYLEALAHYHVVLFGLDWFWSLTHTDTAIFGQSNYKLQHTNAVSIELRCIDCESMCENTSQRYIRDIEHHWDFVTSWFGMMTRNAIRSTFCAHGLKPWEHPDCDNRMYRWTEMNLTQVMSAFINIAIEKSWSLMCEASWQNWKMTSWRHRQITKHFWDMAWQNNLLIQNIIKITHFNVCNES